MMPGSALIPGCIDREDEMLLIPCPNCGARDESEFDYGGRAISYPKLNALPADWHQALHLHEATGDEIDEFWFHASGCECWIKVTRNLVTHRISTVKKSTEETLS